MLLLTIFGVFLLVALVVFGAAWLLDQRSAQARTLRDRLAAIDTAHTRKPSEELALLRDELLSEIPALDNLLRRSSHVGRLQQFLAQGEMKMRAGKFLLLVAALATVFGLVANLLGGRFVYSLIGIAFGGGLPFMVVASKRKRRFRRFEELFPEAIDLLGRAVRAGHAFTTALELIGSELGEPVAGEFRKLYEEQKFGLPIRDALLNLADRIPLMDVKFFVTAVMLQRETGGNLAEILDKLSYVIRERFKVLRQVRVYTAQGRLTMLILMGLPPLICVVMMMMNRDFMVILFTDPIGHLLIAVGITLQTIGYFMIRKIINIQV